MALKTAPIFPGTKGRFCSARQCRSRQFVNCLVALSSHAQKFRSMHVVYTTHYTVWTELYCRGGTLSVVSPRMRLRPTTRTYNRVFLHMHSAKHCFGAVFLAPEKNDTPEQIYAMHREWNSIQEVYYVRESSSSPRYEECPNPVHNTPHNCQASHLYNLPTTA